jgi:hypothetical protein
LFHVVDPSSYSGVVVLEAVKLSLQLEVQQLALELVVHHLEVELALQVVAHHL